ncbi:retrovirus-related pol polyprotein from transposon TNT 1-94 [Tanacetum coccineum]
MESDEMIKSSVENLVPIPSESKDFFDIESKCDVPDCDNSQTTNFSTFPFSSTILPLVMTSQVMRRSKNCFNREHEEYISLLERLLYDNSSPRPPEDFHANPNTIIVSLPIFPIPVEDSDYFSGEMNYFPPFDKKRGTIFNSNKEVVMIAPRVRDVYVLDMTSSAQESYFFAKAFDNLNWLWYKRLAHLNFKKINKLAKQNIVIGLSSLVYSKDKPCSLCEKGKHHRASFKTKQTSSIKKCLHLLHMDLFGHVTPRSINHEIYTVVIVDEYSRYTWVYFLKKKSQAPETIMSFIKRVENQNDIKVKQLRTDNGTEFRMLIASLCPVYIHSHKDHLGKFDKKADDGYLLGYSLVSKAFRVFNTRRQQTKETYHITFEYLMKAMMLSNSQDLQLITSTLLKLEDIHLMNIFILMNLPKVSSDQYGQADQNDQSAQTDEILNDDLSEHYNQQEGIDYDETFAPVARLKIKRIKLKSREDPYRGVINFTGRIKGMHVFVGNFTYIVDFMIVEDISSTIDPGLSQVVLEKPFIEISNMTHDLSLGVVKFTDKINEIVYKMPHKIEQYGSLSDLEKEHSKSVYLRNEEDKRRGVEYVMNKVLGFYKECLEPGLEYLTGVADEGGVT